MTGEQLRGIFENILPRDAIDEAVQALGIQERRRKLDVMGLLMSLVLAGGNHRFGHQALVLRTYVDLGFPKVVRSAFYRWFTAELTILLAHLGALACAWTASRPVHLPGLLAGRTDWRAVDSCTVKLRQELFEHFRGAGDYAALKIHREYSLGVENLVDYSISPARDHDSRHFVVDERRRGQGLLVDLAYVSHAMLRACVQHDVDLVVRVKDGWEFWFDEMASEEARRAWLDDGTLDSRFTAADLKADPEQVVDVDVTVGPVSELIHLRLVSFPTANGRVSFLTTLSRETHSYAEVGLLYRLRWAIETDNKLCKSVLNVDEIDSRTPMSALTLVHAAMLGSVFANAIVHEEHTSRGWTGERRRAIRKAPLHPTPVAEYIARGAERIGVALASEDRAADWDRWASLIIHFGSDPNWRSRPSAIDVVKGRTHKLVPTDAYGRDPKKALAPLKRPRRSRRAA